MSTPALRLTAASIPFGNSPGLVDISMDVGVGERVAVLGPSGAGKTTLLRAIAGLGSIDAGKIEVSGRDVGMVPPELREVVYLHQSPLLFEHMSVRDNVAFPLRIRGIGIAEATRRAEEWLEVVRLTDLAGSSCKSLSGGEQRRVALARAIAAEPRVLLLDEPLSALDPVLRDDVRGSLDRIQRASGIAMVMVTHDIEDAVALADSVAILLDGRMIGPLPTDRMFRNPPSLAVSRFLGIPNEVPGRIDSGRFHSVLGEWPVPEGTGPGPAVAVFPADSCGCAGEHKFSGVVAELRGHPRMATALVRVADELIEVPRMAGLVVGEEILLGISAGDVTFFPGDRGA